MSFVPQEKPPLRQASSEVSSSYAYADSTPSSVEQYKPYTNTQDFASTYQSQYSVPFGEQEEVSVHVDDKIEPQDLHVPQSSPNGMSIQVAASNRTSGDSGQDNAQNGALDNTGRNHRGRSWIDGGVIADTRSDQHKRISQPSAEKVPVERVMSNDYHDVPAQHLNTCKCPIEMNYNSISKYFKSGGKNLGKGGFGIVYEGKMVKYIHVRVSESNPTIVVK